MYTFIPFFLYSIRASWKTIRSFPLKRIFSELLQSILFVFFFLFFVSIPFEMEKSRITTGFVPTNKRPVFSNAFYFYPLNLFTA